MKSTHRSSLTPSMRERVRKKTHGRCHVCGGPLGEKWQADHVLPRHRGGLHREDNYLPACWTCNRVRWHRSSKIIRRILLLGTYMLPQLKRKTEFGREVYETYRIRLTHGRPGGKRRTA